MPQSINWYNVFWTGEKTNRTLTRDITYTALRLCVWGNTSTWVHRVIQEGAPARGSPYTCPLTIPNHTPHNPETVKLNARLYKGELASSSRYDSLFTTLSTHSFSVPLVTWASECWRACRLLSFHYKDSSPPYWKPLPSHRSIFRHCCHSSILTGHISKHMWNNMNNIIYML